MLAEDDDAALAGAAWVGCPATDLIAGYASGCASGCTGGYAVDYLHLFPSISLAYCAAMVAMHP